MDRTIDYTPNSIGKSNAFDLRYNFEKNPPDISIILPGGFNKEDIKKIDSRVKLGDDNPYDPPKLIDMGNHGLTYGVNNDPGAYEAYIDGITTVPQEKNKQASSSMKKPMHPDSLLDRMKTKFWLEDPSVLVSDKYYQIFPSGKMNKIEVLNSLARFFFCLIFIFLLIGSKREYMYIPIIGHICLIVIFFYHKHKRSVFDSSLSNKIKGVSWSGDYDEMKESNIEGMDTLNGDLCQAPTRGNPFMNVTMVDLMSNRMRPVACSVSNPLIKEEIRDNYEKDIIKDIEDVFERDHSSRQFYTMPSSTIPNDQTSFAKWLYEAPPTCKENQLNCLKYEDIRYNRFNPYTDVMLKDPSIG